MSNVIESHMLFDKKAEDILGQIVTHAVGVFVKNKTTFPNSIPITMSAFLHLVDAAINNMVDSAEKVATDSKEVDYVKVAIKADIGALLESVRLSVSTELDLIEDLINKRINNISISKEQ